MRELLLSKIHTRTAMVAATIAVIGLGPSTGSGQGYVGLLLRLGSGQALAVGFAEKGFPGVGIDVAGRKVGSRSDLCSQS